ncbi:probable protein phosphatase 2C 58 [Chrysoperla carnea]|uniref:probable protein phosphatase 2C 58 n=1 Tax=Chrysoperla carnea TaxID=189513 RepID=UPI001D08AEC1|nr:probable protein phosphatase 2C 58 [Chrysoperla carnea]
MGAYLSEPITEKISSDEIGERLSCGASSMQGWRVSQEDAHNCIIDFDENTSLFAVYDGHGGHEVALYCSQKFPEFLKTVESYKKKDYKQALIDAFLQFDGTLPTPEITEILKELAGDKKENKDGEVEYSDEEEPQDEINHLCEEASMPLEKVMEKYQNQHLLKVQDKKPISPYLRYKKESRIAGDGAGSSGESKSFKPSKLTKELNGEVSTESGDSIENDSKEKVNNDEKLSETKSSDNKTEENSKCDEIKSDANKSEESGSGTKPEASNSESNKSEETKSESNKLEETKENKIEEKNEEKPSVNGDVTDKNEEATNGESIKGKGKAKKSPQKVLKDRKAKKMGISTENIQAIYSAILSGFVPDEDTEDSDDEHDDTFKADEVEKNSSEEEEEEEDDEDDEEDESDLGEEEATDEEDDSNEMNDDDDFKMPMTEEPGFDSGCTAVVALLRGDELYVANAGDSRCIVSRKGEVIEMSQDHKPETEEENDRIVKAGGKVTSDGRVNGGLNLSRAIGDHAYKQNKDLPAEEQMITALPDVTKISITPDDEFLVLACDGIWNFMSNEEVIEFVRPRLADGRRKISEICEEMFDHCLAPNTMGDGTGCDNMTAIIVQLQKKIVGGLKRSAEPLSPKQATEEKRLKLDEKTESTTTQSEKSINESTSETTDTKQESNL